MMVINGTSVLRPAKPEIVPSIAFPRPGDTLELRCEVRGLRSGEYNIRWSKIGESRLGDGVMEVDDLLR